MNKREMILCIGFFMIIIGGIFNDIAIAQNNGKMPVKGFVEENKYVLTALHQPMNEDTRFVILSDIILGCSIGDIIRLFGLFVLIPIFVSREFVKEKDCGVRRNEE